MKLYSSLLCVVVFTFGCGIFNKKKSSSSGATPPPPPIVFEDMPGIGDHELIIDTASFSNKTRMNQLITSLERSEDWQPILDEGGVIESDFSDFFKLPASVESLADWIFTNRVRIITGSKFSGSAVRLDLRFTDGEESSERLHQIGGGALVDRLRVDSRTYAQNNGALMEVIVGQHNRSRLDVEEAKLFYNPRSDLEIRLPQDSSNLISVGVILVESSRDITPGDDVPAGQIRHVDSMFVWSVLAHEARHSDPGPEAGEFFHGHVDCPGDHLIEGFRGETICDASINGPNRAGFEALRMLTSQEDLLSEEEKVGAEASLLDSLLRFSHLIPDNGDDN